jgi:hypothetical protein
MTSTVFATGTVIQAPWLNDVNSATYNGTAVYTPAGTGAVATTMQAKLRQTVSVADFGASPSASAATNTAAIQAAIDATPNGGEILIPPGIYSILYGSLNFTRRNSMKLTSGSSKYSAVLQASAVAGSSSTALLDLAGCYSMSFEGISFRGVSASGLGVYIHRPITGADQFSSDHQFVNCYFTQFNVGTQIGRLDAIESNNEDMKFYDCKWENCNTGYSQYYQNALQNVLENCSIWTCPVGINLGSASSQTGSLVIYNGNFSTHTTAAIYFTAPASLTINGARCETMRAFIDQAGWSSTAFPSWSIYDALLINQTNVNYPVITCNGSGFTAVNCQFGNYNESKQWIVSSPYKTKNVLINCKFNNIVTYGISPVGGGYNVIGGYPLGTSGAGQFELVGCMYWDTVTSAYIPLSDSNISYFGIYSITTSTTPDVTQSNIWLVNNTTAPLTITNFNALPNQQFTLVNYINSTQTTTIQNNSAIKTKSGANTVLVSGMTFVRLENVCYEI